MLKSMLKIGDPCDRLETLGGWSQETDGQARNVSVDNADRLAKALGVEAWELMKPHRN